jgi:hypothetical protein
MPLLWGEERLPGVWTGPLDLNNFAFSSLPVSSPPRLLFKRRYPRLEPPPRPAVKTMNG